MHDYQTHLSANVNLAHEYDEFSLYVRDFSCDCNERWTKEYSWMCVPLSSPTHSLQLTVSAHPFTDCDTRSKEKSLLNILWEIFFLLACSHRNGTHMAQCVCEIWALCERHWIWVHLNLVIVWNSIKREIFAGKWFPRKGILCWFYAPWTHHNFPFFLSLKNVYVILLRYPADWKGTSRTKRNETERNSAKSNTERTHPFHLHRHQ